MSNDLFDAMQPTADDHFRLCYYAAVIRLIDQVEQSLGSQAANEMFPFLKGYEDEVGLGGIEDHVERLRAERRWRQALDEWEASVPGHLPLRALREAAGLDDLDLMLIMSVGLVEEDASFGMLFEAMQGVAGQPRPTVSTLGTWWESPSEQGNVYRRVRRLQDLGLFQVANPEAPRTGWSVQIQTPLWDALSGKGASSLPEWAAYTPAAELLDVAELIIPDSLRRPLETLPRLLSGGEIEALVVRGPQHNGRRTLLGSLARAMGRGRLVVEGFSQPSDERWRLIGPLATALNVLPVVVWNLGPAETVLLPRLSAYSGGIGVVLGKEGGVAGAGAERALTLTVEMPDTGMRRRSWERGFGDQRVDDLDQISESFRITSGNIGRTAALARTYTLLDERDVVTAADVLQASRALNRQALDTLATHLPAFGDWSSLALSEGTLLELHTLESRCRYRERLKENVGSALRNQITGGVRALFTGSSGTGKTLAARVLAAVLKKDIYRLDLGAVVNKYIGETEKNLNEAFSRAEELDVILLLDEGDALLTQRTNIQTSNDRYANLETNFLLQRLETFEGILLVTTNASNRIDSAFQRRIDAVIEFQAPGPAERFAIWQLHLPLDHSINARVMRDIAMRCDIKGGQIRNAALHAALLSLTDGGVITTAHMQAAVLREYRKSGDVCPIRFGES
ncbi:MAG TPA: ATP-binding protein [Chloroflexia bacterium]|jgi:hypothetical protein